MARALAPVNTQVYGGRAGNRHDRSTFRERLARPGPENTGEKRLHGVEGGTAGEGDGGIARQLLLAFRRYRRVPRRDPRALARGRCRADHRQCRSRRQRRKSAPTAVAPRVRRKADARESGPRPGRASIPTPAPRCRPSTAAGSAMSKAFWYSPDCRRMSPATARKFCIGLSSASRCRTRRCRRQGSRRWSTKCCGWR